MDAFYKQPAASGEKSGKIRQQFTASRGRLPEIAAIFAAGMERCGDRRNLQKDAQSSKGVGKT
jgi:hypothetical protein